MLTSIVGDREMTTTTFAIIAIVSALALFGVVAVTLVTIPLQLQKAEAAKSPIGECASLFQSRNGSLCRFLVP